MKALHQRLTTLDQQGRAYQLDYVTMCGTGFVYRHCDVVHHDETTIIIQQEGYPETLINTAEIATCRVVQLPLTATHQSLHGTLTYP